MYMQAWLLMFLFWISHAISAEQITLNPLKDNTLYENASGNISNGGGEFIFAGTTARGSSKRRAVLAFDVTSQIPAGATIESVSLTLQMSKSRSGNATSVNLHRLTQDWGESDSNASGEEGSGTAAASNDATWTHGFFEQTAWTTTGGDFIDVASANTSVAGNGSYTWASTPNLVTDVQSWLDNPSQNFGWILIGDEASAATAKRFNSRENTSSPPQLNITYRVAAAPTPLDNPITEVIQQGSQRIRLKSVATGLVAPNWGISAPNDNQHLYVIDQTGQIWRIDLHTYKKTLFVDLSNRLVSLGIGGAGSFDERGLLGLVFHPNHAENGLLYTYTSEPVGIPADFNTLAAGVTADHQSVIIEWRVNQANTPEANVDLNSARVLMRIDQPQFNHDGGGIVFGADGFLYIALGDGGGRDDEHGGSNAETANGQNLAIPLGKILRIDPQGSNAANGQYGIPVDNPFVHQEGVVQEIYAYGLRNPFRISFDRQTGELYAADVGQNAIEELHKIVAGGNYGWSLKEGSFRFYPNGDDRGFVNTDLTGLPDNLIDPVAEYDHDEGTAIIGGFVYRGQAINDLVGQYVFGDVAHTGQGDGRLLYWNNAQIQSFTLSEQNAVDRWVLGFGEDAVGELYVMVNQTGVPFGETGEVWKIIPNSRLDVNNGILSLPSVTVDNSVFQVRLAYIIDSNPLSFRLLSEAVSPLDNSLQRDNAQFDTVTNRLNIPYLDVVLADGTIVSYQANLALTATEPELIFSVIDIQLLNN
ncbi:PQQ-dependent sugar dehydrogenase [Candidatus Albibeggiatoa sp. nov. NOAA]|uniref:PQQ-dependent sugar dehydrogenase n=1 Tax=Candidatus Albibeggiatoa sp. nov. NOAA TaxID=3162724 RepID=UPI0032F2AB20|nr:PQQ-dependent sugar dehydrogenase [Thiotrichaceae bacterium]